MQVAASACSGGQGEAGVRTGVGAWRLVTLDSGGRGESLTLLPLCVLHLPPPTAGSPSLSTVFRSASFQDNTHPAPHTHLGHHDPRVNDLGRGEAHECGVAVPPARGRQHHTHARVCAGQVGASNQQRQAPAASSASSGAAVSEERASLCSCRVGGASMALAAYCGNASTRPRKN